MKKKRQLRRLSPDTVTLLKQVLLGILITALTALIIYGIWHGTRHPNVTIDTVTVSGGETVNHAVIEDKVWQELEGEYLRLIPYRFSYLYPRGNILQALADIPRVKTLTIDRIGRKELKITFTEYVGKYLWCTESGDTCYFTDEETFAFAEAPNLKGGSFLRFTTLGREPGVGQAVMTESEREELFLFIDKLDNRGWEVRSVEVDIESDAYVELTAGGELKLSLTQGAAETYAHLETVLSSEEYAAVAPGEFQYIDLRFGNKVFVNRTEEPVVAPAEEVSETTYEATIENVEPIPEPLDVPVTPEVEAADDDTNNASSTNSAE